MFVQSVGYFSIKYCNFMIEILIAKYLCSFSESEIASPVDGISRDTNFDS